MRVRVLGRRHQRRVLQVIELNGVLRFFGHVERRSPRRSGRIIGDTRSSIVAMLVAVAMLVVGSGAPLPPAGSLYKCACPFLLRAELARRPKFHVAGDFPRTTQVAWSLLAGLVLTATTRLHFGDKVDVLPRKDRLLITEFALLCVSHFQGPLQAPKLLGNARLMADWMSDGKGQVPAIRALAGREFMCQTSLCSLGIEGCSLGPLEMYAQVCVDAADSYGVVARLIRAKWAAPMAALMVEQRVDYAYPEVQYLVSCKLSGLDGRYDGASKF